MVSLFVAYRSGDKDNVWGHRWIRVWNGAPFTFLSEATDEKGYFLATLCPSEVADKRELKECKAFLDLSPLDNCSFPTDINKGISGAMLDSFSFLSHNNMKLHTVRPFFFTSEPIPVSNKY